MDKDIFVRVLLNEKIKLEPSFINKGFRDELVRRLKKKVEGVCSRHGYIKRGSIEIYKIAPGVVDVTSLNGYLIFNIHFYADICNPTLGCVVKCKVSNINKFGILAESGYHDDEKNEYMNVLEMFIAKNSVNIASDVDLESIQIGQELFVEILGKKYELNDKKVTTIGRVVVDKNAKPKGYNAHPKHIDKKEEDEADEDEVYEGEENEADEEAEGDDEEEADGDDEEEEADDEFEQESEEAEEGPEEEDEDEGDGKSSKGGFFSDDEFYNDNEYDMFDDGDDDDDADNDFEDEV